MSRAPISIFALPKAFSGHFGVIQMNAIRSWTLLEPKPEIILLGDDSGTAEVCAEYGLRHEPSIEANEFGTPLMSSLFERGQRLATHDLVCYVNCDIVLGGYFTRAIERISFRRFLMVGRRWDVDVPAPLDFDDPSWEERLKEHAHANGVLDIRPAIDYFVFPRGQWEQLPPFAVGRTTWDNYLIHDARKRRIAVVDATPSVLAVHQSHDLGHVIDAGVSLRKGIEEAANRSFHDAFWGWTTDANWRLTPRLLRPAWDVTRLYRKLQIFFRLHPRLLPRWAETAGRRLLRAFSR